MTPLRALKGSSINYVTRISWFFTPPRPCHRWSHFWDPPYLVWRHIFFNFHLEMITLKQQKFDVTKFRISSSLVTQCHASSTPPSPLTFDVIYGCPLIINKLRLKLLAVLYRGLHKMDSGSPDPFHISFLLPSWRAMRSYRHLEVAGPIWDVDWSYSLHRPSPSWGFAAISLAVW